MAQAPRKKIKKSGDPLQAFFLMAGVFACLLAAILLWGTILYPFMAAGLLAYLMMPLMDNVSGFIKSRAFGALLVVSLLAGLVFVATVSLFPFLKSQAFALLHNLPGYFQGTYQRLVDFVEHARGVMPDALVQELSGGGSLDAARWLGIALKKLLSGGNMVLNAFSFLVLLPLLLFFFLRDGHRGFNYVQALVPPHFAPLVMKQLKAMDAAVSGFIRGQAIIALILGVFYATALSFVGLDFAILIGMGTGLLTFLPYVGVFLGLSTALLVGFQQFESLSMLLWVPGIFAIAQLLDTAFLSPHFVGSRVNLHPVWILLALFIGGSAYGITGAFFAIPVAAMMGVLMRFGANAYRKHPSFLGG